jgi:hypothetical protein
LSHYGTPSSMQVRAVTIFDVLVFTIGDGRVA